MQLKVISGRLMPLRGDDIDTDRILPSRFMRDLTFDNLGQHVFSDDRMQLRLRGELHPIDDPRFASAKILLVNRNFGCGSSREHAPQALHRAGIKAVIGESIGEIFQGNCLAVGMPAVTACEKTIEQLQWLALARPNDECVLDFEKCHIRTGECSYRFAIAEGMRRQICDGTWDAMTTLRSSRDSISKKHDELPYTNW